MRAAAFNASLMNAKGRLTQGLMGTFLRACSQQVYLVDMSATAHDFDVVELCTCSWHCHWYGAPQPKQILRLADARSGQTLLQACMLLV